MKTQNLISVYQGANAIEAEHPNDSKDIKTLKKHEIRNLHSLCYSLKEAGCTSIDFDGYYVSYTIKQIAKEFDLLRIGKDYVLNIEIKSELKVLNKIMKITKQMERNYYYLKVLSKRIYIFEYVENDGLYKYDNEKNKCVKCDYQELIDLIKKQKVDFSIDLDTIFVPSHFLISPFNSTNRFINNDYFLTTQQEKIKKEISDALKNNPMMFFTLSANAGTGKTLLLYDIAKSYISENKKVKIIHCGKLNSGHKKLRLVYGWSIIPIAKISNTQVTEDLSGYDLILVDESQRIREHQLESIVNTAISLNIPVIFSFDVKQFLKDGESLDLYDYLKNKHGNIPCEQKRLTNKIRTNKAMASFITNLGEIGKSNDNLDYSDISIDYFDNMSDLKEYVSNLILNNWKLITFTTDVLHPENDPYKNISTLSNTNAHDVIGQEFPKVALVLDNNFRYIDGKLKAQSRYYSAIGMLYQIVTRVVNELKIIVLNNPELFYNLLRIKKMGDK